MNRYESLITVGWENIAAAPDVATAELLDPDDKGYAPVFGTMYRPPQFVACDVWILEFCKEQAASMK